MTFPFLMKIETYNEDAMISSCTMCIRVPLGADTVFSIKEGKLVVQGSTVALTYLLEKIKRVEVYLR